MRLLTAYLMSVPDIPCIYYGDGMTSATTTPTTKDLAFEGLNKQEEQTKAWLGAWASMRTSRMSMLYGTTTFDGGRGLLPIRRPHGKSQTFT